MTAAGANGSAAGAATSPRPATGIIRGVHIQYAAIPNAGTVVTITSRNPAQAILTVTGNTAGWFYPLVGANAVTNGAAISDVYTPLAVDEHLNATVASGNAGEIIITVLTEV